MKKEIKIKFVDFWPGFKVEEFYLYKILKEKYNVVFSEEPEYLIYSCFGNDNYRYDCIKIFYTGENIRPDFNFCDYAIGFDYMEFGDRYIRYPIYLMLDTYLKNFEMVINNEIEYITKKKFCNMLVSNPESEERNDFFKKLSEYKKVDSGGKIFNKLQFL